MGGGGQGGHHPRETSFRLTLDGMVGSSVALRFLPLVPASYRMTICNLTGDPTPVATKGGIRRATGAIISPSRLDLRARVWIDRRRWAIFPKALTRSGLIQAFVCRAPGREGS